MAISLLTLPYELREQIIMPLLYQEGSIKLQRPVESPSVFTPPIVQVCKMLREEAIRVFYYVNTFTWTIDPEALESTDLAKYPLSDLQVNEKRDITGCPLASMMPWQCPDVITTLRHLRLNLYLPDPYSVRLWEDVLAQQLANLIRAFDNGRRLRDLRVLIVTWHQFRDLSTRQAEMLGIFEQVHMRGHVQVKTRSIDGKLRAALHNLDLTNRMRDSRMSRVPVANREDVKVVESGMDWEWEGGITI